METATSTRFQLLLLLSSLHAACAGQRSTDLEVRQEPVETFRLLLVGKTGTGKSTSGNIILGKVKDAFRTSLSMKSETSKCQLEWAVRNGTMFEVMDSPGLFDTSKSEMETAMEIVRSLSGMNPGPHAVLYTVPIGIRYTEEEKNSFERLEIYLGQNVTKHTIILFTHGNKLKEGDMTIEKYLQDMTPEFQAVLEQCGHRYVVFDKGADSDTQVSTLLTQVRDMTQNGEAHFESELTRKVNEIIFSTVKERMEEANKQEGKYKADENKEEQQQDDSNRDSNYNRRKAYSSDWSCRRGGDCYQTVNNDSGFWTVVGFVAYRIASGVLSYFGV